MSLPLTFIFFGVSKIREFCRLLGIALIKPLKPTERFPFGSHSLVINLLLSGSQLLHVGLLYIQQITKKEMDVLIG